MHKLLLLKGGAPASDLIAAGSEIFLSVTSNGIKNLPASTVNSLPSSFFSTATSSQLSSLKSSPYYSSFSDTVKSTVASAAGFYLTQLI